MVLKFFYFQIVLFLTLSCIKAQSFYAESGDLYSTDNPLVYSCSINVIRGSIKKTDKLDFYSPQGKKFTAEILELSYNYEPVNQILAGQIGNVKVKFSQSFNGLKDYPTYKSKIFPNGFNYVPNPPNDETHLVGFIDGKAWKGKITHKGALLSRNGINVSIIKIDKPCLLLQFKSTVEPDDRILTVLILYPKEKPFVYTYKDLEVNFSGSEVGDSKNPSIFGFVNGKSFPNFSLEIKEWIQQGDKIKINGNLSGELPEVTLLGKSTKKVKFTNTKFENVMVESID